MPGLRDYHGRGQSIWCDYLRRSFVTSGELKSLIGEGLRGLTSNPTIFDHAITGSSDYDDELARLAEEGKPVKEIFEALMIGDIALAADLFRPLYESSGGSDGFVSIEVSPALSGDTRGMISEARRFYYRLSRPNVMIKIPATTAGIAAMEALIAEGINVNVTLIFSVRRYEQVASAYMSGLEKLASSGGDLSKVSSVASFFVSRIDTVVDRELDGLGAKGAQLRGKIAIDSAKLAYQKFREIIGGARWKRLKAKGAMVQRPLWASTSVKDPRYPDTMYVDTLVGPDTVNTVPLATMRAILDHGVLGSRSPLKEGAAEAKAELMKLSKMGVDLDPVTDSLEKEGVASFSKSMKEVLVNLRVKRDALVSELHLESAKLGAYKKAVDQTLRSLAEAKIVQRVWAHDYTVWKPDPTEISNRLDWLHAPEIMQENVPRLGSLVSEVVAERYTHAVLVGMGGSSLAPTVFAKVFREMGAGKGAVDLTVLDTSDPAAIGRVEEKLDLKKTLFIISSKSGETVEVLSLLKHFYQACTETLGKEEAGRHFIAITDPPDSDLSRMAEKGEFLTKVVNEPNLGGRYSALSYDGLVPAALVGVDVGALLTRAQHVVSACEPWVPVAENPGAWLGAILGTLAKAGRDKVTFVISPRVAILGDWIEQLIAESTGKEGKGIVPVVGEPLGVPGTYGDDRLFVSIKLDDDGEQLDEILLHRLERAGFPVVRLRMRDAYDLGRQFFLWEMAIAIAGFVIGINPFDQPNVESAKRLAREMMAKYREKGGLPMAKPILSYEGADVYGDDLHGSSPGEMLAGFLEGARPGNYISIQAYIEPNDVNDVSLLELRVQVRDRYRLATTVGYGPRFLHSTGQLHKGGGKGRGRFVQVSAEEGGKDIPIPDSLGSSKSSATFGTLIRAQMLGDAQALTEAGQKVMRIHVKKDLDGTLRDLADFVKGSGEKRRAR